MKFLKEYYYLVIIGAIILCIIYWDDIKKALTPADKTPVNPTTGAQITGNEVIATYIGIDMKKMLYAGIAKCDEVRQLQSWLLALGYNLGKSGPNKDGVDGAFGSMTQAALGKATNGTVQISLEQFQQFILKKLAFSQTQVTPVNTNPYQVTGVDYVGSWF